MQIITQLIFARIWMKVVRLNTVIPSGFVTTVDQLWYDFKSAFVSFADRHAPIIQRRVRGIDNCPWLNKEIKSVMRQREYFHSTARKTNHSEDWASYRCHRNRVSSATRRQRRPIISALLIRVGTITKLFGERWKKFYLEKRKAASPNISIGGTLNSDKNRIADSFNKYFTSSVIRMLESVWTWTSGSRASPTPSRHYPDFKFAEVSEAYVRSQLRGLKPCKAVGLDNIPARLLVDSADIVAIPLTVIINISLQSGVVPSEWKPARVIPLFKKGKADNVDNYRPISVLPVVSKVLERAVHHQLYANLQCHEFLALINAVSERVIPLSGRYVLRRYNPKEHWPRPVDWCGFHWPAQSIRYRQLWSAAEQIARVWGDASWTWVVQKLSTQPHPSCGISGCVKYC